MTGEKRKGKAIDIPLLRNSDERHPPSIMDGGRLFPDSVGRQLPAITDWRLNFYGGQSSRSIPGGQGRICCAVGGFMRGNNCQRPHQLGLLHLIPSIKMLFVALMVFGAGT